MQRIDSLRRSLRDSFRRKSRDNSIESSKPHQWQADEESVRSGTCYFPVKYLGCVEVFESRGMQVCEEAMKILRENLVPGSRKRPVKANLYISGDGLRVVEEETKGLVVDQTIEKVSFCAPDRNHEKGFSYICRDGTTRRWMLYGFLAHKDSGERLSHAVGCAFAACLERKQRREKECGISMTFDPKSSSFIRSGSLRTSSITDSNSKAPPPRPTSPPSRNGNSTQKITSPESKPNATSMAGAADPGNSNVNAIERPHAPLKMLERQGSFRGFSQLANRSPFKRQLSLRLSELPSEITRTSENAIDVLTSHNITLSPPPTTAANALPNISSGFNNSFTNVVNSNPNPAPPPRNGRSRLHSLPTNSLTGMTIPERTMNGSDPFAKLENKDLVSELCRDITQGLSMLAANHDFSANNTNTSQFPTKFTNPWDEDVNKASTGLPVLPVLDTKNSVTTTPRSNRIEKESVSPKMSPTKINWNIPSSPNKTISNSFSDSQVAPPIDSKNPTSPPPPPRVSQSITSPSSSSGEKPASPSPNARDRFLNSVKASEIPSMSGSGSDTKPSRPPLLSSKSLPGPVLQQQLQPGQQQRLRSAMPKSNSMDSDTLFDTQWAAGTVSKPQNPFTRKQTFQISM